MADQYKTRSTSTQSAVVEDRVLSENTKTRRMVRPQIVNNPNDNSAGVKISIVHQRSTISGIFEDIPAEPLSKLKAGEMMKLNLDSAETKKLYEELQNLYAIHQEKGVARGEREIVVGFEDEIIKTDPKRGNFIRKLIEQGHSEEVWQQLLESDPDLATRLSMARIQQSRAKSLTAFQEMLKQSHGENIWQDFFEKNDWIFGYGLNYRFLRSVTSQPHFGGRTVRGGGDNKGDFLKATTGHIKYTVLVEIKKPQSELLSKNQYRNDTFTPGEDLIGGVSQLRVNAHQWENEGSRTAKNIDELQAQNIHTVSPKQILVVGSTSQLTDRARRESFELFRRGQQDVEILTFDEVLERAKFIVSKDVASDEQSVGGGEW